MACEQCIMQSNGFITVTPKTPQWVFTLALQKIDFELNTCTSSLANILMDPCSSKGFRVWSKTASFQQQHFHSAAARADCFGHMLLQ